MRLHCTVVNKWILAFCIDLSIALGALRSDMIVVNCCLLLYVSVFWKTIVSCCSCVAIHNSHTTAQATKYSYS